MQDVEHIAKKRKKRKNTDYTPKVYTIEDLKYAIQTKNINLAEKVINKIDKKLLNENIFNLALDSKNRDIIRLIVDHTPYGNILIKYKNELQQSILKQRDVQNLVGQMLSDKDNNSFDKEMQSVVYDVYMDVIKKHYKNGNLNKNFDLKNFEQSMNLSQQFLFNPKSINLNSVKDNKFLLLPVYSEGHAFSVVTRKLEDDKYSLTFVNLGARPHENFSSDNKYKEFVYTKKDAESILKQFSINVRIDYPDKVVSVEKAYKVFEHKSLESYILNVDSHNQKTGNCFTKNIEKGIRFALSINLSKAEYSNFDMEKLRLDDRKQYKVKFMKPLYKNYDKYIDNEDLSTVALRYDLIKSLENKFPQYKNVIKEEWNRYDNRKNSNIIVDKRRTQMLNLSL